MNNLKCTIQSLIDQKKEGSFWDFKRQWHKNKAELVRDIISLANGIEHKGERYLIIGVTDPPKCEIVKVKNTEHRKKQADILDLFSKIQFSGGFCPDISLEVISINDKEIDIIIIKDKSQKPYTLMKRYNDGKNYVNPGAVYSRVGDKNIAADSTADIYQTEMMWRERFGLDQNPLERIQLYLLDGKSWQSDGVSKSYYNLFPEFTLEYNINSKNKSEGPWWSNFLGNETTLSEIDFKYHTTILKNIQICRYPVENILIPYPDVDYIQIDKAEYKEAKNTYCLYSYINYTFDFSLLYFLYSSYNYSIEDIFAYRAIKAPEKPSIKHLPFIVFNSKQEKKSFIKSLERDINQFFKDEKITPTHNMGDQKKLEEEKFGYWAYENFFKMKDSSND